VREKLAVVEKVGPQALRDRKRPETVRYFPKKVIQKILRPEKHSLGMAGRAEEAGFAGEGNHTPGTTTIAGINGHPLPGIAAEEKPIDGWVDNRAEGAEGPLKANGVDPEEGLVMIGDDPEMWSLRKSPGPGLDKRKDASGFPHTAEKSTNRAGECKPLERHEINKLMVRRRTPGI
jgi:hypothetical protein